MDRVSKTVLTMMAGGVLLISIIIAVGTNELSAIKDSATEISANSKAEDAKNQPSAPVPAKSLNEVGDEDGVGDDEDIEDDFSDYGEPIVDLDGDDGDDDSEIAAEAEQAESTEFAAERAAAAAESASETAEKAEAAADISKESDTAQDAGI